VIGHGKHAHRIGTEDELRIERGHRRHGGERRGLRQGESGAGLSKAKGPAVARQPLDLRHGGAGNQWWQSSGLPPGLVSVILS
jgi:hypothetical protein